MQGNRALLRGLHAFEAKQFIYASSILVHTLCRPGERIDETQPIALGWMYPKSKARAEEVLRQQHGKIPYVNLRLAGVYDTTSMVPTLARQMARIYERDFQSYFHSGSPMDWEAMHRLKDELPAMVQALKDNPCASTQDTALPCPNRLKRPTGRARTQKRCGPSVKCKFAPSTTPTAGRILSTWVWPLG